LASFERIKKPLANITAYKLLEACRAQGCPVCRVEQQSVKRYLENQLYENVNSPKWRDHLRASLGFCQEHAWLAVEQRLGDALGFTIIYHDILNNILRQLNDGTNPARSSSANVSFLRQIPEQLRNRIEKILQTLTPEKRCPVCEHREEASQSILAVFMDEMKQPEMIQALQSSDGLCVPHLRLALQGVRNVSLAETLLAIHSEKLESLRNELAEFIRKSDYQLIDKGFGSEGDAWLRAIRLIVGHRKAKQ
jgi:hypothetical protein